MAGIMRRFTLALVAAGALGFGAAIYKWTNSSGVSRETAGAPALTSSSGSISAALA